MGLPVQSLPIPLQLSLLEHQGVKESLQCLKVNKTFRRRILFYGPLRKRFSSIYIKLFTHVPKCSSQSNGDRKYPIERLISYQIDDDLFDPTPLENLNHDWHFRIEISHLKLFAGIRFCKHFKMLWDWKIFAKRYQASPGYLNLLKLLPRISSLHTMNVAAYSVEHFSRLLEHFHPNVYHKIQFTMCYGLAGYWVAHSEPSSHDPVTERLEIATKHCQIVSLTESLRYYYKTLEKSHVKRISLTLHSWAELSEMIETTLEDGIPSQDENAEVVGILKGYSRFRDLPDAFMDYSRFILEHGPIEEVKANFQLFQLPPVLLRAGQGRRKAFFQKRISDTKILYCGLFAREIWMTFAATTRPCNSTKTLQNSSN